MIITNTGDISFIERKSVHDYMYKKNQKSKETPTSKMSTVLRKSHSLQTWNQMYLLFSCVL
eukprot:UN01614